MKLFDRAGESKMVGASQIGAVVGIARVAAGSIEMIQCPSAVPSLTGCELYFAIAKFRLPRYMTTYVDSSYSCRYMSTYWVEVHVFFKKCTPYM
eukprot:SAG31_NODE_14342_length_812_cov_1.516129_1_plen_93_part_10